MIKLNRRRKYREVFNNSGGQWVLSDLEHMFSGIKGSFTKADYEPVRAAYYDGQRSVYMWIKGLLDTTPEEERKARIDYMLSQSNKGQP